MQYIIRIIYIFNPISHGGGWIPPPLSNFFNCSKFRIDTIPQKLLTFNICPFTIFQGKKNFKNFRGYPPTGPSKIQCFSKKKLTSTFLQITSYFYCRIQNCYQNEDVCKKKLELKRLRIDQIKMRKLLIEQAFEHIYRLH